jgi:putative membrane protein
MKPIRLAPAVFFLATAAFAQSTAETTGVNSTLGIPPRTEDFVKEVSMSDMFEIESSKLALERGRAATKAFAQQMIEAHQKTTADLKALLDSGKVKAQPGSAMSEDQQESLDELKKLSAADFDSAYQDDQEDAHEDAVDVFKRYAEEGDNPDLKAWAAKTVPDLEHHLQMAQDLEGK